MILLHSDNEYQNAYTDNTGILGSVNFKEIKSIPEIQRFLGLSEGDQAIKKLQATVKIQEPNDDFSEFKGKIKLSGFPKAFEITPDQALFRGSKLTGTPWITALVVYAGHETKTLMNTDYPKKKTSSLEKRINKWVGVILLVLLGLVVFSILTYYFLSNNIFETMSLPEAFVSFTLLFNNIIPISLFVTIDIVRILQVFFIQNDMQKNADFKTGDVNEDLGQIEYVLMDKSGTLTENDFQVCTCFVENEFYAKIENSESSLNFDEDKPLFTNMFVKDSTLRTNVHGPNETIEPSFKSFQRLSQDARALSDGTKMHFLKCMALCNTIVTVGGKILGPSADEKALVEAAGQLGVKLKVKAQKMCQLDVNGVDETYTIMASRPYRPELKKFHVLIKGNDNEPARIFIKGSYEAMGSLFDNDDLKALISSESKRMSHDGLRPVIMASKTMTEANLKDFKSKIEMAKNTPIGLESKWDAV